MSAYILDWFSLIVRWLHVIVGIAWIGSSLYFVWLDNSLENPPEWKKKKGIKGDLWSIHGGGIYEIAKYQLAPESMPQVLHWFKWEAYSTWLTGTALLIIVYYAQASSYLLGGPLALTDPLSAVAIGVGLLVVSVLVYEMLVRSPLRHNSQLFAAVFIGYCLLLCYAAFALLPARAAMMHVGAAIGSIMVGNVFLGIIPSQKELLAAIKEGREPAVSAAEFAKLRSTHNNYLTMPVIFCMIGNHYSMVYAHNYGWLILFTLGAISAYARHFFNLRHQNIVKPMMLVQALFAVIVLAGLIAWGQQKTAPASADTSVSDADIKILVDTRCAGCHADKPTLAGFAAPPAGLVFTSVANVRAQKDRVLQSSVLTQYMPLGNMTGMTSAEREMLGQWLQQQ